MSGTGTAGNRLIACLERIASLLEKGEVTSAAALVEELTTLTSGEPESMTAEEQREARRLLAHCGDLESGLHKSALEAMQRLGAARRSQAYQMPQESSETRR